MANNRFKVEHGLVVSGPSGSNSQFYQEMNIYANTRIEGNLLFISGDLTVQGTTTYVGSIIYTANFIPSVNASLTIGKSSNTWIGHFHDTTFYSTVLPLANGIPLGSLNSRFELFANSGNFANTITVLGTGTTATLNSIFYSATANNANNVFGLSTTGFVSRTGAGTGVARTITGGNSLTVTNGDGISGNPSLSVPIQNGLFANGYGVYVNASSISDGTLSIARGGTGGITATAAINNLLPSQSGSVGYILKTDGTNISWVNPVAGYTGSQGAIGYTGSLGGQGLIGYTGSASTVIGYTGSASTVIGYTGSASTVVGYSGSQGVIGYTGSASTVVGYTGSASTVVGYSGSQGIIGYDGSRGYTGSKGDNGINVTGYTGSLGDQGFIGYTGSASTVVGYSGSRGYTGSASTVIGYTGSASTVIGYSGSASTVIGYSGSQGYTGSGYGTAASVQMGSLGVGTAASGTSGEIRATNNITAYYSDRRLKENIVAIDNALNKLKCISGVYYNSNDIAEKYGYDDRSQQVGVIAQELEAIMPHVVKAAPFDTDYHSNGMQFSVSGEHYKTVQYERIIPLLIEAIKELTSRVEKLEAR
jgi:hypothetical protein